jgi:hypothetical protein
MTQTQYEHEASCLTAPERKYDLSDRQIAHLAIALQVALTDLAQARNQHPLLITRNYIKLANELLFSATVDHTNCFVSHILAEFTGRGNA